MPLDKIEGGLGQFGLVRLITLGLLLNPRWRVFEFGPLVRIVGRRGTDLPRHPVRNRRSLKIVQRTGRLRISQWIE